MLLYVIVYDIPCDKRRRKVAELLVGYGQRVQFSVFEYVLDDRLLGELRRRLKQRVDLDKDRVRFYPMSGHTAGRVEVWGGPEVLQPPGSTIV